MINIYTRTHEVISMLENMLLVLSVSHHVHLMAIHEYRIHIVWHIGYSITTFYGKAI